MSVNSAGETWRTVKQHCLSQIEVHRRVCETQGIPHDETESARAAIKELRAILKLGEPSKIENAKPSQGS